MKKHLQKINEQFARLGLPRWVFVLAIGGLLLVGFEIWSSLGEPSSKPVGSVAAQEPVVRRAIDGMPVSAEWEEPFPLTVIVENMIEARPTSGIAAANLVWEAPAEAGITRFLAIYADGASVSKIGPVRSARPYYVDWAEELHGLFAHVGGSPEALTIIPSRAVTDLNQFWYGNQFWRSNDRSAPHNVYTSTELLKAALADRELTESRAYGVWKYKEDEPYETRPDAQEFSVVFSTPAYTVTWKYHRTENEYVRWQEGVPYRDADGTEVRAKNVAVMITSIEITDAIGRRRITTIGEGEMRVFRDGKMIEGVWRRGNRNERTRFFDQAGNEVELNAGTTWIEVVGDSAAIVITEPVAE